MLSRQILQAMLALVLLCTVFTVLAQDAVSPAEELHKLINVDYKVNTLTTDLFGDQVDLYTGSLSFSQTDVSLRGRSNLPVAIRRSFAVGGAYKLQGARGLFGDWVLDIPRVEVTMASQHLGDDYGTCYRAPNVGGLAFSDTPFSSPPWLSWEYSHGFRLIIPGAGSKELLTRVVGEYTQAPGNDTAYKLVTKDHWQARCVTVSGTPSSSGTGYLVVSPNGTRYYLTQFNTRPAVMMKSATEFKSYLYRVVHQALPSKVVDRFGNTVYYAYNSDGNLKRIHADDGREITLTYYGSSHEAAGQIKSVTAWPGTPQARTWEYAYVDSPSDYTGSQDAFYLSQITLPGHTSSQPRQWHFNLSQLVREGPYYDPVNQTHCNAPTAATGIATGSMIHPMGVTGEFQTSTIRQGRANVTYDCRRNMVTSPRFLWTPRHVFTTSITSKTLTGPGMETLDWTYNYSQTPGWFNNPPFPDNTPHETKKWIEITDPTGASVRHYFSMVWDATEGQLLETQYKNASGTVLRTEKRTYGLTQRRMDSPQSRSNGLKAGTTSRLTRLETRQDGDTYIKTLANYTVFDQAQTVKKFTNGNDIPNQDTRTETYTLLNDTSISAPSPSSTVWVLGLPDTTTVNGIETKDYGYSGGTRQLTSIREFGIVTARFGYHSDGTLYWFDDALDNRTTYSNYKLGIPRLITYPDNTTLTIGVNADGSINSKTDARGFTTGYEYDTSGRLKKIDYPNNDSINWADTTINFAPVASSEYGIPAGHWRQIVTRGDNQITTYFDGLLRPIITRTRDIGGQAIFTSRAFDHAGRELFSAYPSYTAPNYDPAAIMTTDGTKNTFDALGRLTQKKDTTDGSHTSIAYWSNNRKIVTDPRGNQTRYEYQVFAQPAYESPTKIIAAYNQPEQATTTINRDILGRMLTATQSGTYNGQTVTETRRYVYDSRGQLCKRVDPETGQSAFYFDNAGNLKWSATNVGGTPTACESSVSNTNYGSIPASKVVVNAYDNRNRLIATDYPSGTADSCYQYGPTGNLTRLATLNEYGSSCPTSGTLTRWQYGYNGLNLLESETLLVDSQTFALSYGYNANGHKDRITYPTGRSFTLSPDGLGRSTKVGGMATDIDYHANGSLKNFTYYSGAEYTASQTAEQLPNVIAITRNSSNQTSLNYDYDAANNVTRILDSVVSVNTITMSYDALNRLETATASLWGTASYKYDPLGNLRQKTINGGTANYSYAANNRLDSITGSISRSYQYDASGNVTADGNHQYDYDLANRLTTVTGTASYEYDGHGKRVKHVDLNNNETSYSVYSKAGKRMHQYNVTTNTPEDFIYLGNMTIAKLVGLPPSTAVPSLSISNDPADGNYTVNWTAVGQTNEYQLQERKGSGNWQAEYNGTELNHAVNGKSGGEYQYRIRACSDEGCAPWRTSAIAGVAPQTPPASVTAPTGSQMSTSYTVSWPTVEGATRYTLREQYNGGAWVTVQDTASRTKSFNQSAGGDYRHAVRACNSYGCSDYRYGTTFYIVEPVVASISISGGPADGSYTVSWANIDNINAYKLQERKNEGSWQTVYSGTAQSFAATNRAIAGWQYQVQACVNDGCGAWKASAYAAVVPTVPSSISTPTGTQTTAGYTVSWPASTGATHYTLREQRNGGAWITAQNTASRSKSFSKPAGDYRYAVRACHAYGCSAYRYSATFTIALPPAPTGLGISGGPADGDYTVTWNTVAYANQYLLQERKNSGGWQNVYSGSALNYAANNRSAGGYQYRVRACTDVGCGAWATSATAGVVPKTPGSISTPTGTRTNGSYDVSWSSSYGATRYTLLERINGGSWHTEQNTSSRSKGFSKGDGDYRYAVKACNSHGCSGYRYSTTFTIEIPPAIPGNLTVSSGSYSYNVSWNSVSGAIRYQLQERSKYDSWSTIQNSSSRSADAFLMGPERYFYRVRACKATYCSSWSPEVSIYVSGDTGGGGKW